MLNEWMGIDRLEVGGCRRLAQRVGDDHAATGASDWSTRPDRGQEVVHSNGKEENVIFCLVTAAFIIPGILAIHIVQISLLNIDIHLNNSILVADSDVTYRSG